MLQNLTESYRVCCSFLIHSCIFNWPTKRAGGADDSAGAIVLSGHLQEIVSPGNLSGNFEPNTLFNLWRGILALLFMSGDISSCSVIAPLISMEPHGQ